jgi:glutaredoxin 3
MSEVTIYTTATCGYCQMAKRLLAQKGIAAKEVDVGVDHLLMRDMMQRTGRRTVPQIYIGEQHVGGYDDLVRMEQQGALDEALAA